MKLIKKILLLLFLLIPNFSFSYYVEEYIKNNGFGQKYVSTESEHFRLHHPKELRETAEEIAHILEKLHGIYRDKYKLTLPDKTDVIVSDDDNSGGWAIPFEDIIHIWANDFDWNLRGTTNWLENVVAHEYAHVISIWAGYKIPQKIPYIQYGYFDHYNERKRGDLLHIYPSEILPPWFTEGIAQYESTKMEGDSWDSHRNMILRTLALSGKLISWDHMQVFSADKSYEYELTYNHGFSLVLYIAEKYGEEFLVSIIREASKMPRLNFDRAIKAALGISGRDLYKEWKAATTAKYKKELSDIGDQVYGRKVKLKGWNYYRPRFSPDDSLLYFQYNQNGYRGKSILGSIDLSKEKDTIPKFTTELKSVTSFYDIHDSTYRVLFTSSKEKKSTLPAAKGGKSARDLFIEKLTKPNEKKKKLFAPKTEKQVTIQKSIFHGVFSPTGDSIAVSKHIKNRFVLMMVDSSGKKEQYLYPPKDKPELGIHTIYGLDWSPDGKYISVDYLDKNDRKIGVFDIKSQKFYNVCNTENDERNPRFSSNGKSIYFSSDRSGIFNIYRYNFEAKTLDQLTNVSGGAFDPDVSKDGSKLAYIGFDDSFYGLYLFDTLKVINSIKVPTDSAMVERRGYEPKKFLTANMRQRKYNRFPKDLLVVPMLFGEEIMSKDGNAYKGQPSFKIGTMLQLVDPLFWANKGNSILAYFTFNPNRFPINLNVIFDKSEGEVIDRKADFDFALMGYSQVLPIDIELSLFQRAISGKDFFYSDYYLGTVLLDYNLNPTFLQLNLKHKFNELLSLSFNADYLRYKVWVNAKAEESVSDKFYSYIPTKGFNGGLTLEAKALTSYFRSNIAPTPFQFRLKYNYNQQYMQNEINSFDFDGASVKERYVAPYKYHSVSTDFLFGTPVPMTSKIPWLKDHRFTFDIHGSAVYLTEKSRKGLKKSVAKEELINDEIPSYMEPAVQVPGYTYYYKDSIKVVTQTVINGSGIQSAYLDTSLVSGKGVISGNLSYKFPLFPGNIGKKVGFLYFEYLYGGINYGGAASVDNFKDLIQLKRSEILTYLGFEIRLSSIAFSSYPLMVNFRYDYGLDLKGSKDKPLGGSHFSLKFDFELDRFFFHSSNRPDDLKRAAMPQMIKREN